MTQISECDRIFDGMASDVREMEEHRDTRREKETSVLQLSTSTSVLICLRGREEPVAPHICRAWSYDSKWPFSSDLGKRESAARDFECDRKALNVPNSNRPPSTDPTDVW